MTRMRRALSLVATALLASGCGLLEVQVPVSFEVHRDFEFVTPDDTDVVPLPVAVEWKAGDLAADGRSFAVFLDTSPVGPGDVVRLRLCADRESEPPVVGQDRSRCRTDIGERVWITKDTRLVLDCIKPKESASDRVRNRHMVTVIVIDEDHVRVGQAGISRTFEVEDDAALRACSGELEI